MIHAEAAMQSLQETIKLAELQYVIGAQQARYIQAVAAAAGGNWRKIPRGLRTERGDCKAFSAEDLPRYFGNVTNTEQLLEVLNGPDKKFMHSSVFCAKDTNEVMHYFMIGKRLGSGRYSKVKCVVDLATGQRYVIKIQGDKRNTAQRKYPLLPEQKKDLFDNLLLAKKEAEFIISHVPNLLLSAFENKFSHKHYMVLEKIEGLSLDNFLQTEHSKNKEVAKKIARSLVIMFADLQCDNIVHGDVKPENIIIDPQSFVCTLVDYGFSEIVAGEESYTTCVSGTYRYMDADARADISNNLASERFAMGLILAQVYINAGFLLKRPAEEFEKPMSLEADFSDSSKSMAYIYETVDTLSPEERVEAKQALRSIRNLIHVNRDARDMPILEFFQPHADGIAEKHHYYSETDLQCIFPPKKTFMLGLFGKRHKSPELPVTKEERKMKKSQSNGF